LFDRRSKRFHIALVAALQRFTPEWNRAMALPSGFPARLAGGDFDTHAESHEAVRVRLAAQSRRAGMTANDLVEQVEAALSASRRRIVKLTFAGQPVWVKRPRRGPGYTLYSLHFVAAQLLGIRLFRPPKVSRGPSGLAAEARRLAHLQGKGWPVPRVLAVTPRWLALSDNGPSLSDVVAGLGVPERSSMLRAALEFLQTLHAGPGWHGAAQMRNLTRLQHGFGAIDFEDDLQPAMPLESRQARDIYLFLVSAARYADRDASLVPYLLEDALRRASASVCDEMTSVGAKLMRAERVLGWSAPYLGRDGPALAAIARAFRTR
jgi:tRNA A-37 threonylcarbamoyl transferase component Bud32